MFHYNAWPALSIVSTPFLSQSRCWRQLLISLAYTVLGHQLQGKVVQCQDKVRWHKQQSHDPIQYSVLLVIDPGSKWYLTSSSLMLYQIQTGVSDWFTFSRLRSWIPVPHDLEQVVQSAHSAQHGISHSRSLHDCSWVTSPGHSAEVPWQVLDRILLPSPHDTEQVVHKLQTVHFIPFIRWKLSVKTWSLVHFSNSNSV